MVMMMNVFIMKPVMIWDIWEDTGNHDVRTEGMSYGMMVCVQLDKKSRV